MRIGFDVDGVLANFTHAYQALTVQAAEGLNLFKPGDDVNPPCWNWPEFRGYSPETMRMVWSKITQDPSWWARLAPLDGAESLAMCMPEFDQQHDIYYVTARPGDTAKRQTEMWLRNYIGCPAPTVLIASDKGSIMRGLRLDVYIDDNLDNIKACASENTDEAAWAKANEKPARFNTRLFLLNRNYNQGPDCSAWTRVRSVGQMFDYLTLGI